MVKRVKYFSKNILYQNKQKDVEAHFDQKNIKLNGEKKPNNIKWVEKEELAKYKKLLGPNDRNKNKTQLLYILPQKCSTSVLFKLCKNLYISTRATVTV